MPLRVNKKGMNFMNYKLLIKKRGLNPPIAGRGSINFATDRQEPTPSPSKEGNKKNAAYYSSRAWAICQLRKITGISPTNKIAKAGTEASTNLSSDAY